MPLRDCCPECLLGVGTAIRRPQRADIAAGGVDTSSAGIDSTGVRQLPGHCGHTARQRLNGRSRRPAPVAFAKRPAAPSLGLSVAPWDVSNWPALTHREVHSRLLDGWDASACCRSETRPGRRCRRSLEWDCGGVGACRVDPRYHDVLAVKVCALALRALAPCGRLRTLTACAASWCSGLGQSRPTQTGVRHVDVFHLFRSRRRCAAGA